jgi:hypothetical protein
MDIETDDMASEVARLNELGCIVLVQSGKGVRS